jgi:hypothetical protein
MNYCTSLTTLYTNVPSAVSSYFTLNYGVDDIPNVTIIYDSVPTPAICFKEDTKILCFKDGAEIYIRIDELKKGDLVKTNTGEHVPVSMLGTSKLYNPGNSVRTANRLYTYTTQSSAELIEPLVLTGLHAVLVDSVPDSVQNLISRICRGVGKLGEKYLLPACLDTTSKPYSVEGQYTVWHVVLESDTDDGAYGIYANGLLVESCSKEMFLKCMERVE